MRFHAIPHTLVVFVLRFEQFEFRKTFSKTDKKLISFGSIADFLLVGCGFLLNLLLR